MDQSTHDVRRANWLNIVNQCQGSPVGMSVKQWLEDAAGIRRVVLACGVVGLRN